MEKFGLIMAGGGGTRFWPLSTTQIPKQFLNLTGNDALINESIERMKLLIKKENIYIITNESQIDLMKEIVKDKIDLNHIISEPEARNTTACIAFALTKIRKEKGDGVILITPADHYIKDLEEFKSTIDSALRLAEDKKELITIGIKPTFPSTGYGYLRREDSKSEISKVSEFLEKPSIEKAEEFIKNEIFLWNSGMFIWEIDVFFDKLKKYLPTFYDEIKKLSIYMETNEEKKVIQRIYPKLQKISVDYAVMEPASLQGEVYCIKGDFGWNDVGGWQTLDSIHDVDENNNVHVGNATLIDTNNSVLYSTGQHIATIGLNNVVIVATDKSILVCDRTRAEEVKEIVEQLKKENRKELL